MNQSSPRAIKGGLAPRDRIIRHAIEILAVSGFEAMTMRQLGNAVGLDNSSLYRHFASKAELISAALDAVTAEVSAAVGASADLSRPATLQGVEDAAAHAGVYFFDHPLAARLIMHWLLSMGGGAESTPAFDKSRPHGRLMTAVRNWLGAGARQGFLRKHAAPEAMVILLAIILMRPATHGYLLNSLEPKRNRAAARKAWEIELRAVVRGAFEP